MRLRLEQIWLPSVELRTAKERTRVMVKKASKVTSQPVATNASQTLASESTGKASKSAAASALSQTAAPKKQTGAEAATAASKTLTDGRTSQTSKSAAGSALAQSTGKKKNSN